MAPSHRFETNAIHAGQLPDEDTGAVMPPIHTATTYEQDAPGVDRGFEYARTGNPTRSVLEDNLAALEEAAHCRAFASGMAAINTVLNLLEAGDHVVAEQDLYGGTHRIFRQVYRQYDIEFTFVDMADAAAIEAACQPNTEVLWAETPTNPLLKIVDIENIAAIANEADALFVVDNTFATPYLQQPLQFGADIVAHSLTKYLGGHSDVVGGALMTDSAELDEALGFYQNAVGATPDPFGCFLVLRGTKTLPLRMESHCENASQIATWLQRQSEVDQVYYPGLSEHPNHDIAKRQMRDFGGMVSFELDADLETTSAILTDLELFTLAESLGGVESLIEQPASMTHAGMSPAERRQAGVSDGLIRASVGVEHIDDLLADLADAFDTHL